MKMKEREPPRCGTMPTKEDGLPTWKRLSSSSFWFLVNLLLQKTPYATDSKCWMLWIMRKVCLLRSCIQNIGKNYYWMRIVGKGKRHAERHEKKAWVNFFQSSGLELKIVIAFRVRYHNNHYYCHYTPFQHFYFLELQHNGLLDMLVCLKRYETDFTRLGCELWFQQFIYKRLWSRSTHARKIMFGMV